MATALRRTALALLGLLAALAARGSAAPCSPAFGALAAEVELRAHLVLYPDTPEEKAEKKALGRVQRALRRHSTSYRKDAATAALAGTTLLSLYPGNGAVADLVQGTLDGLRADLGLERNDLALTADELPGGDLADRALAGVAEADAALAVHDAAGALDVEARTAALGTAALAVEKGFRGALPGRDGRRRRTCGDEMWVDQGGGLRWRADLVTGTYVDAADEFFLTGIRARRPADDSELDLVVENVFGVGTYPIDFGTGIWRDTFTQYGIVQSGTLTITAFDKVKGTAEGTFAFTARGCIFDCSTYEVTGGVFRLAHLNVP
jgi:hypothetical protein